MSDYLQLVLEITIILVAAKAAGYLSTRFGQPSVLGELLVGVLLGPSLIDITHLKFVTDTHLEVVIHELGEMGVLLLMFLAGLELHLSDMRKNTRVALLAGVLGVIFPVGLGVLVGELYGMEFSQSLFLGLTLGATSVSISAQVLMELKVLRSKVGMGLLGAAIFDDVLVILLLSIAVAFLSGGGSVLQILLVFGKMLLFLVIAAAFGLYALPWLVRHTARLQVSQGLTTLGIVVLFSYGLAAELVGGMAAITGTFVAGLMFARMPEKSALESSLHSLAYAFFIPIFFVSIGLNVDLRLITVDVFWILLVVSILAILGKVLGAGGGALLAKFNPRESLQLGIGMVSRGEVGLIIARIGLGSGFLDNKTLTIIVGMILVTTLVTPPLLRASFKEPKPKKPAPQTDPEP